MKKIKKLLCAVLAVLVIISSFAVVSFAAEGDVARMTVISCTTNVDILGHSWVYIENLTDEPLIVGLYELPGGEGVSIGTGKYHRGNGAGIYYNVESYLINNLDSAKGRYSLSIEINAEQLKKVSDTINANNRWKVHFNCSNFAEKVFNSAGERKVYSLGTPSFLKTYIKLFTPYDKNYPHMDIPAERCYKQNGSRLDVVNSKSLSYPF